MEWRKSVGDGVTKGELLAVIETDKVTVDVTASESGILSQILKPADSTVEVGNALAEIEVGAAPTAVPASAPASTPVPPVSNQAAAAPSPPTTPALAGLKGIALGFARAAAIRAGTWPPVGVPASPAAEPTAAPTKPVAAPVTGRGERRVPLSFVRVLSARKLQEVQQTAALLSTFQEVDMTAAIALRDKYKDLFMKKHDVPLGLLSLFVKASSSALTAEPGVNAVIDDGSNEIVYRDYADVSVPIPTPRGQVPCTLYDAGRMSVTDIERTLSQLMQRARSDDLSMEDIGDATFGIVDSGSAGGMLGTSVINPPMSAIMGTNAVTKRACVVKGKVVARDIMYISLTYDHRLVDGREAVTFLCAVRDKLEDPARLLLDL